MATMIEQQVVLDEALVPSTQRLRIGRSNFKLPLDIQSKESTLQVVYDVLHRCPFFKAIHGQSFDELSFEEEILDFLRFLGHSAQIRTLTDVNVNKLFQPWRSFGAVINKYLTGKSSSFDSFRLSQAQILWGLYHSRNIDYEFLIWEDFMYQVKHKNHKRATRSPKPKASARRKRSGSDTSITPPTAVTTLTTTVAITLRLTAAAKGKQPAKAKSPSDPSEYNT
nr:hypothetical protein [Tanacetum cinerariifolium]